MVGPGSRDVEVMIAVTTFVIPAHAGSSTPRPFGLIIAAYGILDRPPSRTMTAVNILAARCARSFERKPCPPIRGRREDRVRAAPAVSRAMCIKKMRTRAYRFGGNTPAFPAQWLYGLLHARPGDRLSCHRHLRKLWASAKLDASTGASGPHDFAVRKCHARLRDIASTASHPAL